MAPAQLRDRATKKGLVSLLVLCLVFSAWSGAAAPSTSESDDPSLSSLDEETPYVLRGPVYAFFNHNSETWDSEKRTLQASRRLLEIVREHDIPVVSTVEGFEGDDPVEEHFLDAEDITYSVKSSNGSHSLLFPNVRQIILSGGYLGQCLSQAMEDIYSGIFSSRDRRSRSHDPVQIYMVADAIYLQSSRAQALYDRNRRDTVEDSAFPLLRAMALMTDEVLIRQLIEALDLRKDPPRQEDETPAFNPREVRVRIFRGDHQIHEVGHGDVTFDLILIDTVMLEKELSRTVR